MKPKLKTEENFGGIKILTPPCITLGLTRLRKRSSLPSCTKRPTDSYPVVNLTRPFSSPLLSKMVDKPSQKSSSRSLVTNFPLKIGLSTPSRKKRVTSSSQTPKSEETIGSDEQFKGWNLNDADCLESERRRTKFAEYIDHLNRVSGEFGNNSGESNSENNSCDIEQISCLNPPTGESSSFSEENSNGLKLKNCRVVISRICRLDGGLVDDKNESIEVCEASESDVCDELTIL